MVTAGAELTPGTTVDRRYRIQCTLGRGGFGRTYLAADEQRFNELCVLKEFVPNAQADPVVSQKLRELFQREAETLHQLDHIQIPQFFAGFEAEERLFIAQEYIDGKTYWRLLQERQRQGCSFSQSEVLVWLNDLLKVLDYLHSQNIVHRDISPDNVMLKRGTRLPVLIDFGVVKQIIPHLHLVNPHDPDGLIQASVSVGKFGYAPYEQIRMGQCSPRSDLYALAVTAVVLLTGKPPNLLMDAKSLDWNWQRQVRLDPQVTQHLTKMMAEKPQERHASAQEVLQALQPLEPLIITSSVKASLVRPQVTRSPRALRRKSATQWQQPVSSIAVEPDYAESQAALNQAALNQAALNQTQVTVAESAVLVKSLINSQTGAVGDWADSEAVTEADALSSNITGGKLEVVAAAFDAVTEIESVPAPIQSQALVLSASQPLEPNLSSGQLLRFIQAQLRPTASQKLSQAPRDNLGNSTRFSLSRVLVLSILSILPLGGVALGIRSPHIAPLCWVLSNCAVDAAIESRYQQAIEQADSVGLLLHHARDLTGLQQARQKLADSIAQLNAFSGNLKVYASAHLALPRYQLLLKRLDENLEQESRAAQLLNRAEAEAQKATEQTKLAKTYQHYQTAQLQWRRVLATLAAVPEGTFVTAGAAARLQEYQARLDAVSLKVMASMPKGSVSRASASPIVRSALPAAPRPTASARSLPSPIASPVRHTAAQPPSRPAPAPRPIIIVRQEVVQPGRPQRTATTSASQPRASRSRAVSPPVASIPSRTPKTPATSPLQVDRQWVAGSVITLATQTLDNVAIWIDGTRTEADGKFVANLWIQNRSGRGFGIEPLYAESKDDNGQTHRSRVLFTSNVDTMLEPGEGLSGQIYLLDRPAIDTSRLTLVVQESTSGERSFRIPF